VPLLGGEMIVRKNFHYNYAFVFYDANEKRVQKIFKICKKYLAHYQFSVFRGAITPSKLLSLRRELKEVMNEKEDFICIVKLMNENVFDEEVLGIAHNTTGEDLII